MPDVRCPQCGTMVELLLIGLEPECWVGTCSKCGQGFIETGRVPLRERLGAHAHATGRVLFAVSAIPLLIVWLIALFGWLGIIGVVIGVVVFPSVYIAPFVMLVVNGAGTLSLVALGLWVVNVVGVVLLRLSGREP